MEDISTAIAPVESAPVTVAEPVVAINMCSTDCRRASAN
jgi:hypothetical protein